MNQSLIRRRLKIRDLELLIAIDELQSLNRVAEQMHTSQPAVSRSLSQVEEALGVPLFERTAKGMVPTPYGTTLIRHARQCIETLDHATEDIAAIQQGLQGHLYVGANYSSASFLLPKALSELAILAPGLTVSVREGALDELMPELLGHKLDLVIARLGQIHVPGQFRAEVLIDEPMRIVCGTAHPLTRLASVGWRDLSPYPWILPPRHSAVRRSLDDMLRSHGLSRPHCRVESASLLLNTALLNSSDCLTIISRTAATQLSRQGLLHHLDFDLPQLFDPLGMIQLEGGRSVPGLDLLLDCLRKVAGQCQTA